MKEAHLQRVGIVRFGDSVEPYQTSQLEILRGLVAASRLENTSLLAENKSPLTESWWKQEAMARYASLVTELCVILRELEMLLAGK
jgi:hypothetical protein